MVKQWEAEKDLTIRRALLLSLGEYGLAALSSKERQSLSPKLREVYRSDSDAGLHAAAEWLLRTWGEEAWLQQVNEEWATDREQRETRLEAIKKTLTEANRAASAPVVPPQWYLNTQGQTFVVIPGRVEFVMGSPKSEKNRFDDEDPHKRRIGRSFAIAAKSVTLAQYRSLTGDRHEIGERFTRYPDLPVVGVSWYMAARYCNLLSKVENVPEDHWCYETDAEGVVTKLKENYLSLSGYRLPTEAEMEYAMRAGASTSRYFGETADLLEHYAWYAKNANDLVQRVGLKKPNDFGLFDAQGNCFTWCQDAYLKYPTGDEIAEDKENKLDIVSTQSRVMRGGSFFYLAEAIRSANRSYYAPTGRLNSYGFRPARTFTP
jgi:formylglycine-generating enzyme required for sulfatase activity